jgi:dihydrofolate synthase/folylpolyglutamate synthase
LRQAVRELYRGRRVILILGISQDKDLAGMLRVLLPMASVVVFTRANHPRGAFPEHLRELAAGFGHGTRFLTAGNAAEALERSCALAGPEDLILGTGSIYLVGDLRGAAIRSRS